MSRTYMKTEPFPLDWDEWQVQWQAWKTRNARHLKPTSFRFPGKNFLADNILGTWSVNGKNVELSEVTFPNLHERDAKTGRLLQYNYRAVGITFGTRANSDQPDNPVVRTFDDLEHELGINEYGTRTQN